MPAVIERMNSLIYLRIHFDRILTYKTQVESKKKKKKKIRCKKGLSTLKAMASKGIKQRHLFLLYQSVIPSVTVFGYKDFCGSTVLGTPESVGIKGQIDWQA